MNNEIEKEATKEALIDGLYNACEDVCKTLTIDEIMETIEESKKRIKDHLLLLPYSKKEQTPYLDWAFEDFGYRGGITAEVIDKLAPHTIIAKGEIENSEKGLFMVNSNIGKKLLWVAKKGGGDDWAIYTFWAEKGIDYVLKHGDKVSKYNVHKLVPVDDEALKMYRS